MAHLFIMNSGEPRGPPSTESALSQKLTYVLIGNSAKVGCSSRLTQCGQVVITASSNSIALIL